MTYWVDPAKHTYEPVRQTEQRYSELAATIAAVVLDTNHEPMFEGEYGRVKEALLLASIASYESNFERDMMNCKITGDSGIAFGPWQTHTKKNETCNNIISAATHALRMARTSLDWCKGQRLPDRLSGYTDGKCRTSQASRNRMNRALNYFKENNFNFLKIEELD